MNQHQDGHSPVLLSTIPNCITYDPCYGYELAVIVQEGLRRMFAEKEDVFYYVTLMNEKYAQPAMPVGAREGILKGIYRLRTVGEEDGVKVRLLGSGAILREVEAAGRSRL
jgi:pyruvate dehydrogenase E1 component